MSSDFATKHRGAAVVGTDLSPIQDVFIPSNLRFEILNFCEPWSYSEDSFDLIFLRGLYGSVEDWPRLYSEIYMYDHVGSFRRARGRSNKYRALKPGAFIEHSEMSIELKSDDGTVPPNHIFDRWGKTLLEASEAYGKSLGIANQTKELIEATGFVDVVEKVFKWPIGRWGHGRRLREIGRLNKAHWEISMEGWCIALLTRALKVSITESTLTCHLTKVLYHDQWTVPQVKEFLREMEEALKDGNIHAYHEV